MGVNVNFTTISLGNSIILSATSCESGTLTWYNATTGGSSIGTGNAFGYTPPAAGNFTYYAACESGSCKSNRVASPNVEVIGSVANPTGVTVSDAEICLSTSINLSANCSQGTVTWHNQSSGGTSIGTGSPLSQSPISTITFYASCKDGVNESGRIATVQVVVLTIPNAPTAISVDNAAICNGTSISLSATCASGAVTWYNQSSGGISIGINTNLTQTPASTTTYYAACENECGASNRVATNEVVVTQIPTNPSDVAVSATNISLGNSINLSATCAAGTLTWYNQATGGTSIGTGNLTTYTPASAGSFIYYAACENGNCKSSRTSTPQINVNGTIANPTNVAINQTEICVGQSISLSADCSTGIVIWYNQATGGTSIGSGSPFVQAPSTGTNTYYAACKDVNIESGRIATNILVAIAIPENPTAVSASQTAICSGASISLSATCASGSIIWYNQLSGGTALGSGNSLSQSPTSTTTYYASCENGSCASSRVATSEVVVTQGVNIPDNILVNQTAICSGTSISLSATCTSGVITWYNQATGGTSIGTGTNLAQSPSVTTTYYASCKNGICESSRVASQSVQVTQNVTNPTGVSVNQTNICNGSPVTLSATCATGTINWYDSISGAAELGTGNNFIQTPSVSTTYYATCENGICVSSKIATLQVVVTQNVNDPTSILVSNNNICSGTSISLSATCISGVITWYNSETAVSSIGTGNAFMQTPSSSTEYFVSCKDGICESDKITTGLVQVTPNVTSPTNILPNQSTCIGTSISLSGICASGTLTWYDNASGGAALGTGTNFSQSPNSTTTYYASCENGICVSGRVSTIITVNELPNAQIEGSDILNCTTTSVTLTAGGGVSYIWSNGLGTNAQVSISSVGTYTVTVTDVNGCSATATTNVTLNNIAPTVSIEGSNNLNCATTSVTRTASGLGVSYVWSNGLGTDATATITSAGTYTVTAIGSNGCTATATTTVTNDGSLPNVQITGADNLSCAVTSVTRTASGGATYLWSNGLGTNAQATITTAGIYTVTVTGTNGCTATATTTVTNDGSLPNVQITGADNLSCAVTSVTRTASGGATYLWSNGLGTNAQATITTAGIYTVTVTGTNGCTATATTTVTNDGSLPNVQITGADNLSCAVTSVTRTASGGTTYLWSNGLGTNPQATITTAGVYTVTVTGTNGCTATATTTVTNDGSLPNVQITGADNLSCAVTSVTRTASGGATYLWSNGLGTNPQATITTAGIYTVTVTGTNGCTATATTTVTNDGSLPNVQITGADNLSCAVTSVTRTASGGATYLWSNGLGTNPQATITTAGIYTVTVTGTNGCTATATTTVTNDGSLPNVQITGVDNLSCAVTSVTRTASGGATYLWSNGLGTNAQATITTAGIYTVTVTGTNGCTATATTTVTNDGSLPNIQITGADNLSCAVTSVTRTASGGATYLWSNGLGTNPQVTITTAGIYTVTVTGTNGCTATATTTVTNDGSLPNVQITGADNLTCAVTSVTRTASGGATYLWSNGLGTNAQATITTAGIYTVTVTGTNGCTATATTAVTFINDLVATASNTGPYQLGNQIELSVSAANTYAWSGPNSFVSSAQNPTIPNALLVNAGVYSVTITQGNCTATATTNVIVLGIDPCALGIDLQLVGAGNPYSQLFSLTNGMNINQINEEVSILAIPVCPTSTIESVNMQIQSATINETILQNVSPYAIFDNTGTQINGRVLPAGTYTVTITGYSQDNLQGTVVYGPIVTTFTILQNAASISNPTLSKTTLCSGSSLDVNFSTSGIYNLGNQFNVELSDENGNFGSNPLIGNTSGNTTLISPIIIGTSNVAGTIACTIPQGVMGGNNYKIRVISTNGISVSSTSNTIMIHPKDLNLLSPTDDFSTNIGTKQASNKVTASNKISATANVNYQAGKAILLNAGFEANAGSVFKAEISGCNN